jgi:chondroitin 4-sulfotransferase 11
MNAAAAPWIFVHVQKTGGNSVRAALGGDIFDARKHFLARELREVYGRAAWDSRFKFSVVRNPWDRLVSWWSLIDNARQYLDLTKPPNKFFGYVLTRARSFEEFLLRCDDEIIDSDGRKNIFRNQIDYLVDDDGTIIVDLVGRFERLQESFDEISRRLGRKPVELPRTNVSRHRAYSEYYTPALAEMVAKHYARDIETFGYRFGQR